MGSVNVFLICCQNITHFLSCLSQLGIKKGRVFLLFLPISFLVHLLIMIRFSTYVVVQF